MSENKSLDQLNKLDEKYESIIKNLYRSAINEPKINNKHIFIESILELFSSCSLLNIVKYDLTNPNEPAKEDNNFDASPEKIERIKTIVNNQVTNLLKIASSESSHNGRVILTESALNMIRAVNELDDFVRIQE